MNELRRLVALIADSLGATDPARLYRPIPIVELMDRIVPYRTSRRHLDVVTSEEYELLLLRLAAGEAGLARTDPPETLARFRQELGTLQPDLAVLRMDEHATMTLARDAVAALLEGAGGQGYAPPAQPGAAPPAVEEVEIVEWEAADDVHAERCGCCGGTLPAGRAVNFCPHCGQSVRALHCPQCNEEVELGWRHCVACGAALARQ